MDSKDNMDQDVGREPERRMPALGDPWKCISEEETDLLWERARRLVQAINAGYRNAGKKEAE